MIIERECIFCGGRGALAHDQYRECEQCDGSGTQEIDTRLRHKRERLERRAIQMGNNVDHHADDIYGPRGNQ